MQWISQICQLLTFDVISIDGKTVRGSSHKQAGKPASHIINAFAARQKATLGCVKTPDKSNEIKGIPILLKALNPSGCIITIDAMGTQKGIANLIRLKRAHYLLALKQNHKRFYRKVEHLFQFADDKEYNAMVYEKFSTHEYEHSRIEQRNYTVLPIMYLHSYKKCWRDLAAIVRVQSTRTHINGNVETHTRYYITSLPFHQYEKMCHAIRQHWQVENSLHYKLDVGLHEDQCQIFRGFADQNLAIMRKIVLKLLENEKSTQQGIALKRTQAALSTRYLRKVVGF